MGDKRVGISQMDNEALKKEVFDKGLALLVEAGKLTQADLADAKVEFGYLLTIEGHGMETLFKILQGGNTYYIVSQNGKLAIWDADEVQYAATVEFIGMQYPI